MRIIYLLLFFITFSISAQIELKIDSITSIDSIPSERKFTVNYHIQNTTDKEISFVLFPKSFNPNMRGSMSQGIVYKIYQNDEFFDFEDVFINKKMDLFKKTMEDAKNQEERTTILKVFLKKEANMDLDSIKSKNEKILSIEDKKTIKSSIITLNPRETISYTKTLYWNKKRYFKIEDNEFYLDEIKPHYIEFTITLMENDFNKKFYSKNSEALLKNLNFIKGWFTSNKVEINFKE
jgi:uncharacterized protein (DUF2344 family)